MDSARWHISSNIFSLHSFLCFHPNPITEAPNFKLTPKPTITHPCSQPWEKMQNASGGRFCDHCTKVVRDFRQSSPDEIYDAFQQANGNVCGRFYSHQLAAAPIVHSSPIRESLIRFALALWLCFAPLFGTAQNDGDKPLLSKDGLPIAEKYSGKHSLPEIENNGSAIDGSPDGNFTNDTILLEGTDTPTYDFQWTSAAVDTQFAILNPEYELVTTTMGSMVYVEEITLLIDFNDDVLLGMMSFPGHIDSTKPMPQESQNINAQRVLTLPPNSPEENPSPNNSAIILPPGRKEEEDENSPPAI
jgi:hypothetical protein